MTLIYTGVKAQSPTKQQTVDWIMNQTGKLAISTFLSLFRLVGTGDGAVLYYPDKCSPSGYTVEDVRAADFKNIKGINYTKTEKGYYQMNLTGDFGSVISNKNDNRSTFYGFEEYLVDCYVMPNRHKNLIITYNVSEDEFMRIKKAYEHLAKLCGANLISDDLFKN